MLGYKSISFLKCLTYTYFNSPYYRSANKCHHKFIWECNAKNGMKKFHLDPEKYHCKHSNKIVSEILPTRYGPLYIRLPIRFFSLKFKSFILHAKHCLVPDVILPISGSWSMNYETPSVKYVMLWIGVSRVSVPWFFCSQDFGSFLLSDNGCSRTIMLCSVSPITLLGGQGQWSGSMSRQRLEVKAKVKNWGWMSGA